MEFIKPLRLYLKAYSVVVCLFLGNSVSGQSLLENTQLRFFTDAGFTAARDTSEKLMPAFHSGGIEILLTAQISDKISILAEPVLRSNGTLSMERAMLKYSFANYLTISAGRLYTPIGLWNTTFFRYAKALTPTIDAPTVIANFEEGGTAINKDDGIQISGDDISRLRFGYRLMVSNGYNQASSRYKMFIGNVFIEPLDNLKFAFNVVYQETLPGSPTQGATVTVPGLSVMYMGSKPFEFASELYRAYVHPDATGDGPYNVFYLYAGYKVKSVTPYLQYYNGYLTFTARYTTASLGIRYNLTPLSVLKAELLFLETDDFTKIDQIKLLWAIGF
jgi:hypothetical protein